MLRAGSDRRYDDFVGRLKTSMRSAADFEFNARSVAGDLAIAIQAALLTTYGNPAIREVFFATRLDQSWGTVYGTLPSEDGVETIVARAIAATK